jgi:Fe-S cluster assembly protein SufD
MHKQLKEEKDPFALVNAAYFSGGLFLYLPPKTRFEGNLRIIHLIEGLDQPTLLTPRIHFFIGKQASAKIIYTQKSPLKNIWVNAYMDFALEEEATLKLATISEQDAQSHDFLTLRASLKSRSHFKSCGITNGGATSRHDYCVHLQGEEAHASLNGIWNIKQNRQHHVNVWMEHQEPHATSLQKFKGIVSDNGRSSFEGKIYVHKEAQKTEAYQMSNNLLLSEHATAYAKPNLEIFADDVKASHGATVGQLDEESLFYLKSRGIPLSLARNLLIQGFLEEILSFFDEKTIRKEAAEVVT